jgi:hypothetical protein
MNVIDYIKSIAGIGDVGRSVTSGVDRDRKLLLLLLVLLLVVL